MNKLKPLVVCASILGLNYKWLIAEADAGRIPCLHTVDNVLADPEAVQEALLERTCMPWTSVAPTRPGNFWATKTNGALCLVAVWNDGGLRCLAMGKKDEERIEDFEWWMRIADPPLPPRVQC